MDLVVEILEYANSFARGIGLLLLSAVRLILPPADVLEYLAAPIGWLILLTAGLAVTEVAKKLAWLVIGAGWLLVAIRIVMVAVRS